MPNLVTYDPAFAFEIAIIIRDGIRRMYEEREDIFYYLTLYNENYPMPPMPEGAREGILKGMYKFKAFRNFRHENGKVNLLGSGPMINEVLKAQKILAEKYGVAARCLERNKLQGAAPRWTWMLNDGILLNPGGTPKIPYVAASFERVKRELFLLHLPIIMKALPDSISKWVPGPLYSLGTDGYGRSESRSNLRDFFEVDAKYITIAAFERTCAKTKLGVIWFEMQ